MSKKLKLSQKQIQFLATDQSFSRGKTLYSQGAISHTIQRDKEIEGRCKGSYPEPYRVWAKFSDTETVTTSCNCQYDWGGDCKHIVAMLLTYLHHPERFEERQTLNDALLSRTKEDLVDIILLMVTRYPDLKNIVDQPTPNEVIAGVATLDMLSFRQELRDSFQSYGYDYYDSYDGSGNSQPSVSQIASMAKRFSDRDDWRNAALIYRTILEEFAQLDTNYYHDDEGFLAYEIDEVISTIDECLQHAEVINDDTERRAIFEALLGVYLWDVNFGGTDLGADAPDIILKHIRKDDIAQLRTLTELTRDQLLNKRYSDWAVEGLNAFITELDTLDEVDPEIILNRLRAQGINYLLISKLLDLQRIDEAIVVIRQDIPDNYERIKSLLLFVEKRHKDLAIQIAEDALAAHVDMNLLTWLLQWIDEKDDQQRLFHWQQVKMTHQPTLEDYSKLKQIAQRLNQWEALRPQIYIDLAKKREFDVLIRVYLLEEEWALAWETLPKVEKSHYYSQPLDLNVAEATRHIFPNQAIPVYIKYVRKAIANRNRGDYANVASLLVFSGDIDPQNRLTTSCSPGHSEIPRRFE